MHRACAADDEILAKLPTFGPPPQTWEDCMASRKYELLSCSAEDRNAGEYHSAPVLHAPSNMIYLVVVVMFVFMLLIPWHCCNLSCDMLGSPLIMFGVQGSAMHVTDCSWVSDLLRSVQLQ